MTDSNELIGRLRGDAERILAASGNAGEYRFSVLRESVRQECEECGHKLLGVVRADAVSGARRSCLYTAERSTGIPHWSGGCAVSPSPLP